MVPDGHPQFKPLLALLGEFTDNVSDLASLRIQRDTAKKNLEKQETEYIKWRKQYVSFPPLAEQQEKNRAVAQKNFEDLDKQLKQRAGSRDKLAEALAMSVISNRGDSRGGQSGEVEGERVLFLEQELGFWKSQTLEIQDKWKQSATKIGQIHSIQSSQAKLQNQIMDLSHKIDKVSSSTTDSSFVNLEKQISRLQERLGLVQDRVDDIPNLKLDYSKSKQDLRDLQNQVNAQADTLKELKGAVYGENDDKGVIDVMTNMEEDLDKMRTAMKTANDELHEFQTELHKFGGRVAVVERGTSRRLTPQPVTAVARYDDTELRSALESIKQEMGSNKEQFASLKDEVADLDNGLTMLRGEQDGKDELVGSAIDGLNASISQLNETVKSHRSEVDAIIGRISTSVSTLEARSSTPVVASNPPTPQALTNGAAWKPEDPAIKRIHQTLGQHLATLKRHQDTITVVERAWQALDGRFNTLTTDRLVQNMVHQMSQMYPHAANLQAELELGKRRDEELRKDFGEMASKIFPLSTRISNLEQFNQEHQPKDLNEMLATLSKDIITNGTHTKHELASVTQRIDSVDSSLKTQSSQLREALDSVRNDVKALSSDVEDIQSAAAVELGSLAAQVERLNDHCGLIAAPVTVDDRSVNADPAPASASAPAVVNQDLANTQTTTVGNENERSLPTGTEPRMKCFLKKKRKRVVESESE